MLNRKLSARMAILLICMHRLVEIAGLMFINFMPQALISFGGLTGSLLDWKRSNGS